MFEEPNRLLLLPFSSCACVRACVRACVCIPLPLSVCLSYMSVCLSVSLSLCLSVCLSVCLSLCLSVYLFFFLSLCFIFEDELPEIHPTHKIDRPALVHRVFGQFSRNVFNWLFDPALFVTCQDLPEMCILCCILKKKSVQSERFVPPPHPTLHSVFDLIVVNVGR